MGISRIIIWVVGLLTKPSRSSLDNMFDLLPAKLGVRRTPSLDSPTHLLALAGLLMLELNPEL